MADEFTTMGPPIPAGDIPTIADAISAAQAQVELAKAQADAAAASAASAAQAATNAWAAPALTTVYGAPVLSVFGRSAATGESNIVATFGDYSFSQISGVLAPSQLPALAGAITSQAGSNVTTLSSIPNDTPVAGWLLFNEVTDPPTPPSGKTRLYISNGSLRTPSAINDAGAEFVMVQPGSASPGYFLTGVGTNGSLQSAQPSTVNFSTLQGQAAISQMPADVIAASIEFVFSGGGSPLQTGMQGWVEVPFPCTISQVTMMADQSGNFVADVWRCTYAQYQPGVHPVAADSICGSSLPTINSASKSQDATLTGWTTTLAAGDILAFVVHASATNITQATISLRVVKT